MIKNNKMIELDLSFFINNLLIFKFEWPALCIKRSGVIIKNWFFSITVASGAAIKSCTRCWDVGSYWGVDRCFLTFTNGIRNCCQWNPITPDNWQKNSIWCIELFFYKRFCFNALGYCHFMVNNRLASILKFYRSF